VARATLIGVNEGRGSGEDEPVTHGTAREHDLEVIELEPSDDATPRADATRETLQRRRGPVVVAVIVAIALVGVTIAGRTHHSSRRTTSPTTNANRTNIDLNDRPAPTNPFFAPLHVGAQMLTGGLSGLRLFDTDTGRQSTPNVSGLPPGPVTIVAHSGTTVAVRLDAGLFWFSLPDLVAHHVDADTAFPSAHAGRLWLASHRVATEVPGDTDRLPRARVTTPGPAIGATNAGLLVVTKAGVLVQPITGTGTTRLLVGAPATVIGVNADRVAWVTNDCGVLRCAVHVTEVASGATSTWLQLVGHPNPLVTAGTSAVFSPDGGSIAIAEPDDDVTGPATLLVANLRTRATTVVAADKQFEQPARPGSSDGSGTTIDWTRDGEYLVFGAPSVGADRVGMMDPTVATIGPGGPAPGAGTSVAVVGVSTVKSIHPPAGNEGPIDTGGPAPFDLAGLRLIGVDGARADVLDLDTNRVATFPTGGPVPNAAGPNSIARVIGGWLVVRTDGAHVVVDLLPDGGGPAREIAPGFQVLSSDRGRHAWIVDAVGSTVRSYDPSTDTLGSPVVAPTGIMVAVDAGLVFSVVNGGRTRLNVVDPSGKQHSGPVIDAPQINLLAGAGARIAYTDSDGLHVYDLTTQENQIVSTAPIVAAAFSPNGNAIAWVESEATQTNVLAEALNAGFGASDNVVVGGPADRVLVADDGTVLYTNGSDLFRGRADTGGSSPVSGLAPDPNAVLALG
jgi:hypothetical protein